MLSNGRECDYWTRERPVPPENLIRDDARVLPRVELDSNELPLRCPHLVGDAELPGSLCMDEAPTV